MGNKRNIRGNIIDIIHRRIYGAELIIENGRITQIYETGIKEKTFLLPGFIDAHVHIESSMSTPTNFVRAAVKHGTLGSVSDPHEIANVLGLKGVMYMLEQAHDLPFYCWIGAPSCVPATPYESSGGNITTEEVIDLLRRDDVPFLAEMMNFPGVISGERETELKLQAAQAMGKPIDGHAPLLSDEDLIKYISSGISTEHEASSYEEGLEKIQKGMHILIREGSAGRNFDNLIRLLAEFPEQVMFCTDDAHPTTLCKGHINLLVKRAIIAGYDLYNTLRAASYNPARHYHIPLGMLQPGDWADFIIVDNPLELNILESFYRGKQILANNKVKITAKVPQTINNFKAQPLSEADVKVKVKGEKIRVIQCFDGDILTKEEIYNVTEKEGYAISNRENDILKLVVVNRYKPSKPAVAFIKGTGLKEGAVAQSIMHDSHNIIAVGVDDTDIVRAINLVIEAKGGIAVAKDLEEFILPLPIAGIMSPLPIEEIDSAYQELEQKIALLGTPLHSLQMTLSFMGLLVIPSLKLSDQGLFDSNLFAFTDLFVQT